MTPSSHGRPVAGGRPPRSSLGIAAVWLLGAAIALAEPAKGPRELGLLPAPQGDLLGFYRATGVPALPDDGELVVEKVRPVDCRVVRGFVHSPVDGRPDSWGYNGVVNEYDDSQGYADGHWQNICYEHLKDPGVHVTLADDRGFNWLWLRGGFMGRIYRDVDADDGPGKGTLLAEVKESCGAERPEHYRIHRLPFDSPPATRKVSFFGRERLLSDAAFLRVGALATRKAYGGSRDFAVAGPVADLAALGPDFRRLRAGEGEQHPSNFERRFPRAGDRAAFELAPADAGAKGAAVPLDVAKSVHFLTPPLPANLPVGAARLDLELRGAPEGNLVCLAVQDPLVGNQELLRVDVRMGASPRVRVLLDFPDQLVSEGHRFWITVASQHPATLGAGTRFSLLTVSPREARDEHFAWRMFLLKGCFYVLSEARPWTGRAMSAKWLEEYDGGSWEIQRVRPQLIELFRTVENLVALDPGHPIAARQYHDWLTRASRSPIDPVAAAAPSAGPGVPRWAELLDRAVKGVSEIPSWWIANRMASNGELGGQLSDDTDMIPWWVPLAMLDSEGFAPRTREIAGRLSRLVLAHNLRDGVNLRTTDPLHAYEEGQNLMCQIPLLEYGDPRHIEWLMQSARTAEKWLWRAPDGKLRFRVGEFGWETAMKPPEKPAEKVSGNAGLLLHSHLMLAWYNRNPRAVDVLRDVADPAAGNALGGFGGPSIPFAAFWFTGDPKFLRIPEGGKDARGQPWARFLPEYVAHAREARSAPWWKAYAQQVGRGWENGDWAWAAAQDRETLCRSLEFALYGNPHSKGGGASRYRYIWTEAEMFTDRIFLPVEAIAQPMLGGYTVRNRLFPAYAVSFERLGGDFAALVLDQGRDRLRLAMINLRDTPREGAFIPWQLDHGRYEMRFGPDADDNGALDSVEKTETLELARMSRVPVTLPPRRLVLCEIEQKEKLDDLLARADLAVSQEDLALSEAAVRVTVHNLGAAAVEGAIVALADARGAVLASAVLPRLDPPLDLLPRTATIELPRKPGAAAVVLDPEGKVPEITRGNNSAPLTAR
jgi:hypothetical protein